MRVIHDRDGDLALYRGPGYPMRRRDAELVEVPGSRHQPVKNVRGTWSVDPEWGRWHVIVLMDPRDRYAISLFRDVASGRPEFWYVDVIGPATRRSFGFDFQEHGLDVVVRPDLASWQWKDADELEWGIAHGRYSRAEADELYATGRRAVDRLRSERETFEAWLTWTPDPTWSVPSMPSGWDAL